MSTYSTTKFSTTWSTKWRTYYSTIGNASGKAISSAFVTTKPRLPVGATNCATDCAVNLNAFGSAISIPQLSATSLPFLSAVENPVKGTDLSTAQASIYATNLQAFRITDQSTVDPTPYAAF
eukprot:gene29967-33839_t